MKSAMQAGLGVALVALSCAGCSGALHNQGSSGVATTPSSSSTTDPIQLSGPPGGDFASVPDLATPMTLARAIAVARAQGGGTPPRAPDAETAPVGTLVTTYSDYEAKAGGAMQQLGVDNTVVVVTVHAPYLALDTPRPPGATVNTWPQYTLVFDARSGSTLYKGPANLAP